MVVKVYISGISGNKEVKKRQQRVLMILDSKNIKYDVIDITEPGRESDKEFMQTNSTSSGGTVSDPNPRSPLPPQVFNEDEYCGDYDQFDMANEVDTLEQFLKVEIPPENVEVAQNGEVEKPLNGDISSQKENSSKESSQERQTESVENEKSPPKENDNVEIEPETVKETVSEVETANTEETESAMETEEQESKENTPPKENNSDVITDDVTESKMTPSEALIESEQTAASD